MRVVDVHPRRVLDRELVGPVLAGHDRRLRDVGDAVLALGTVSPWKCSVVGWSSLVLDDELDVVALLHVDLGPGIIPLNAIASMNCPSRPPTAICDTVRLKTLTSSSIRASSSWFARGVGLPCPPGSPRRPARACPPSPARVMPPAAEPVAPVAAGAVVPCRPPSVAVTVRDHPQVLVSGHGAERVVRAGLERRHVERRRLPVGRSGRSRRSCRRPSTAERVGRLSVVRDGERQRLARRAPRSSSGRS